MKSRWNSVNQGLGDEAGGTRPRLPTGLQGSKSAEPAFMAFMGLGFYSVIIVPLTLKGK